jgi:hypothetical protein
MALTKVRKIGSQLKVINDPRDAVHVAVFDSKSQHAAELTRFQKLLCEFVRFMIGKTNVRDPSNEGMGF